MTAFENISNIELNSLIKITSLSHYDEYTNTCKVNDLAVVIDKDYLTNSIKVRLLQLKKNVWLDRSTCFEYITTI